MDALSVAGEESDFEGNASDYDSSVESSSFYDPADDIMKFVTPDDGPGGRILPADIELQRYLLD